MPANRSTMIAPLHYNPRTNLLKLVMTSLQERYFFFSNWLPYTHISFKSKIQPLFFVNAYTTLLMLHITEKLNNSETHFCTILHATYLTYFLKKGLLVNAFIIAVYSIRIASSSVYISLDARIFCLHTEANQYRIHEVI